jgi:two-component system, sensor histidine kinase PdtaS
VTALEELLRGIGSVGPVERERLQALVGEWGLLADLSFADLLLFVPTGSAPTGRVPTGSIPVGRVPPDRPDRPGEPGSADLEFVVVAQVRPATGPTVHPTDLLGSRLRRESLTTAWRERRIVREGEPDYEDGVPVRVEAIPVPLDDRLIAVLARDTNLVVTRWPSPLEATYLRTANDLALMVAEGRFPFPATPGEVLEAPRVGDGLLRLDEHGVVSYASPNAISSYRRLGHTGNLTGGRLRDVHVGLRLTTSSPERRGVENAALRHVPQADEFEVDGVVVVLRAIPLLSGSEPGALVLVRDVSELRRREAMLLSKDATIREIHHRVKNNLQTVAALLRLQARRMTVPEASEALRESVRRVTSIALVHETLSQSLAESVDFDRVADQLAGLTMDVAVTGARPTIRRIGSFGELPGAMATPLSLVLSELLQNAVEHGAARRIELEVHRSDDAIDVLVLDDGRGLPAGFALEGSDRLGLQIVRSLVGAEMRGTFTLRRRDQDAPGTEARLHIPSVAALSGN